jgi:hypothetical protein
MYVMTYLLLAPCMCSIQENDSPQSNFASWCQTEYKLWQLPLQSILHPNRIMTSKLTSTEFDGKKTVTATTKRMVATTTDSVLVVNRVSGPNYRFESQHATGYNSRYGFALSPGKMNDDRDLQTNWILELQEPRATKFSTALEKKLDESVRPLINESDDKYWLLPLFDKQVLLPDVLKLTGFTVLSFIQQPNQIDLEFRYIISGSGESKVKCSFSKLDNGCVSEFEERRLVQKELTTQRLKAAKRVKSLTLSNNYNYTTEIWSDDKLTYSMKYDGDSDTVFGDPESHFFRLSYFGLPEPEGVVWEKPTPMWVWLIVAGSVLAILAMGFRFLQKRVARKAAAA